MVNDGTKQGPTDSDILAEALAMDAGEVVTPNSAPTPGSISSGSRQSGLNESGSMDLTEIPDGGLQRRQSIYSTVVASKVSISNPNTNVTCHIIAGSFVNSTDQRMSSHSSLMYVPPINVFKYQYTLCLFC